MLGGVTAVFDMPNTDPLTTTAAALADKLARAQRRMHCDFAFYIGATHENIAVLPALERRPGCAGIKVVMGSSFATLLVEDDASVRNILKVVNRPPSFHCEDEYRLRARIGERIAGDVHSHPVWRDAQCALMCTQRLIALARETDKRVHVVHVSTAQEIDLLGANKDIATVEATPHHLTLAAPDCYDCVGTLAQINPPIRDATHRAGLWRGISDGVIDIVGSDHGPQLLADKTKPYPASLPGMTGVQTLVPLMLDRHGWPS